MEQLSIHFPEIAEIVPKKLYWLSQDTVTKKIPGIIFFSIDSDLQYVPFAKDFGPLHIGHIYRYCKKLQQILNEEGSANILIHICGTSPEKKENAILLCASYQIICLKRSAKSALECFKNVSSLKGFRDALDGPCTYRLSIFDCIRGLSKAIELGWFNLLTFNLDIYLHLSSFCGGDINWIIPNKFLALSGPVSCSCRGSSCIIGTMQPEKYLPIFKSLGVKMIVRLNRKEYDETIFAKNGIHHIDLFIPDGTCPTMPIVDTFIRATESVDGIIAVHCKAGLGRTGCLIGCYAIRNYGYDAAAWIGWNRLCRPGSILGPQQHFLHAYENFLIKNKSKNGTHQSNFDVMDVNCNSQGQMSQGKNLLKAKARMLAASNHEKYARETNSTEF